MLNSFDHTFNKSGVIKNPQQFSVYAFPILVPNFIPPQNGIRFRLKTRLNQDSSQNRNVLITDMKTDI